MFVNVLLIGAAIICLTVVIHALMLDRIIAIVTRVDLLFLRRYFKRWRVPVLVIVVLAVFVSHIIQIWLWALFYLFIQALPDLESALYFSTTTFSTAGYGDIVLNSPWRLISSFQAASGFLLFGWSAAFIFEVMSKLYERDPSFSFKIKEP